MYGKYKDQGFVVLGFPSGDFGDQEYDDHEKILKFAQEKYKITFPLFEKSHVKEDPLFQWLVKQKGGFFNDQMKWNFTKFLIGRNGQVIKRFAPSTKPEKIGKEVKKQL